MAKNGVYLGLNIRNLYHRWRLDYMNAKKLLAMGTLMGCSSLAFAVANDITQLDIVIRDFQPNHPDFENFSEEAHAHKNEIFNYPLMSANGFDMDWYNATVYHETCGNDATKFGSTIGIDGKPHQKNTSLPSYLQETSATTTVLKYGECSNSTVNGITQRGYERVGVDASTGDPQVQGFVCSNNAVVWANPVLCLMYIQGDALTNKSLRDRFCLPETSSSSSSRLIKEAISKGLIKVLDPRTAPRYMKYIPVWA